ncbi:MAG TPA: alpha/beta hydrolase [Candidatus Acidoferrum sp.]|nr:alpha/beta hydrolase [Candidatus Acidoferrum sp.]
MKKPSLTADVVVIDGRPTYFWQRNPKAADSAVLVLHGFMADYRSMEPFVTALQVPPKTRVLLPDLPGFGASEPLGDEPSVDDYVDWAVKFVRTVAPDIKQLTIIGYSFGAYIAIVLASRGVLPLKKMTLITPVVKITVPVQLYTSGFDSLAAVSMKAVTKLYTWQPNFDFTTYYLSKTKSREQKEKLKLHRRTELATLRPELVLNLYRTLADMDLLPYAGCIDVPVMVVMAQKDNLASNRSTKQFIHRLRTYVYQTVVPRAGHLLPYEDPLLLAQLISRHGL